MTQVKLGRCGIISPKNAFGALPIQRVDDKTAVRLLRKAYANGFTFFDTARAYSDSEHKIGLAMSQSYKTDGYEYIPREKITIATKSGATTPNRLRRDLERSLSELGCGYIDIYQLHNPSFCPKPGDGTGIYETLLEFKAEGKIKHIGITNHRLNVAREAVTSGLYETLQFPFCYLASEADIELVKLCRELNVGFIAMKALSGGLITRSDAAYAFMLRYDNVLPIWGIQHESELDEFISYFDNEPASDELDALILHDRSELSGSFCRGCGYCMPCPAGIEIFNCARMSQLIRRSPSANWLTEEKQKMMENITNCKNCGRCKSKCPYGLDTPTLLRQNLDDYRKIVSGEIKI